MHIHAHVFFHYCALSLIILKQRGGKRQKQLKQKRKRVKATNEEEIKKKTLDWKASARRGQEGQG